MLGMSPLVSPALMVRQAPRVTLTDLRESSSALTTYTFTSCGINLGATAGGADTYGTDPHVRATSRSFVAAFVHGEDAAATFGVNSVTIGGVSGTERVDRGGVSNPMNSAIYTWTTESLQGITNTDIAVTWSEAVTNCAIGVVAVENIGLNAVVATGSASGATHVTLSIGADSNPFSVALACSTSTALDEVSWLLRNPSTATAQSSLYAAYQLYCEKNANFTYAAAWGYVQSYLPSSAALINRSWTGVSTTNDMAAGLFQ